jgi:hypothetical protein
VRRLRLHWQEDLVLRLLVAWVLIFTLLVAVAHSQVSTQGDQCIANAAAGGTANAITIPLLPCSTNTNLLLLTAAFANTSTTPTLQQVGGPALPIVRGDGSPMQGGDIAGAGYVALLTSTGTSWVLLNPDNQSPPNVATLYSTPGDPTGTTSTTAVMMGLGGGLHITPRVSGNVVLTICGSVSNVTGTDGGAVYEAIGTGSAPTNGAAPAGTEVGTTILASGLSAGGFAPYCVTGIAQGLSIGTTYWVDLALRVQGGGTASLTRTSVVGQEIP